MLTWPYLGAGTEVEKIIFISHLIILNPITSIIFCQELELTGRVFRFSRIRKSKKGEYLLRLVAVVTQCRSDVSGPSLPQ